MSGSPNGVRLKRTSAILISGCPGVPVCGCVRSHCVHSCVKQDMTGYRMHANTCPQLPDCMGAWTYVGLFMQRRICPRNPQNHKLFKALEASVSLTTSTLHCTCMCRPSDHSSLAGMALSTNPNSTLYVHVQVIGSLFPSWHGSVYNMDMGDQVSCCDPALAQKDYMANNLKSSCETCAKVGCSNPALAQKDFNLKSSCGT